MFDSHEESDLVEMSQRERDRLKVLYGVSRKERSQKEAARLLKLTTRQVRRLDKQGDQGLVRGDSSITTWLRGIHARQRHAAATVQMPYFENLVLDVQTRLANL